VIHLKAEPTRLRVPLAKMQALASYWWILLLLLALLAYPWIFRLFGIVVIPQDSVGVINKKFVLFGTHRSLPDGCIIALRGEAGIQADTLAPGIHFGYTSVSGPGVTGNSIFE